MEIPQVLLPQVARQKIWADTVEGYELFYMWVHNRRPPNHVIQWVKEIYEADSKDIGTVVEAHRGSTKTTSLTITLAAYKVGCHPEKAGLLIQVGDEIANDNSEQIADIIANNAGWKVCFPHVIPDREKGWGAQGYEVKQTHELTGEELPYEVWRRRNSDRKDPSFLGLGYKSHAIIGKHPNNFLIVDDIHDENNTASDRELAGVKKRLMSNIMPARVPWNPLTIFVGTPWVENDILQTLKATKEYHVIKTPLYKTSKKGMKGAVHDKDIDQWIEISWPEGFPLKRVQEERRVDQLMSGGSEFARMFILDLSVSSNRVFRFQGFPNDEIHWDWPMIGGLDYAGTADEYKNREQKNDPMAIAYVAKLPTGGAVVVDGVRDWVTQGEAEEQAIKAQNTFAGWLFCVMEGDGKGEEFIQVVMRNPGMRVVPMKTGGKSKAKRLEKQMAPWFRNGRVRISDAETPFLNALRNEMRLYPHNQTDDCMDAVYWALRGMPEVLQMQETSEEELPETETVRSSNPWNAVGMAHG